MRERPGDGIRLALDQRPDVIMLDINLPDMDGFKVCKLFKENASTQSGRPRRCDSSRDRHA